MTTDAPTQAPPDLIPRLRRQYAIEEKQHEPHNRRPLAVSQADLRRRKKRRQVAAMLREVAQTTGA